MFRLTAAQASALQLMQQQSSQVGLRSFDSEHHLQKCYLLLPSLTCTTGSMHPAGQVKRQRHEHQPLSAAAEPAVDNMLESDRRVVLSRFSFIGSNVMHC